MSRIRIAILAVLMVVSTLAGCVWFAPSRPYDRGFILVDGSPILHNYCRLRFTEVRVTQVGKEEGGAYWEAVATAPQESLPILASAVPGYEISGSGNLDSSKPLLIGYTEEGGTAGSFAVNLSNLRGGQVGFSGGIEGRDSFLRHWRSDFGC